MMGSRGLGHQLRAHSETGPFPKPLLLGLLPCGPASRVQLFPCFSVSTLQGRGWFFSLVWGPLQGPLVSGKDWGPLSSVSLTLPDSWSLPQGPGWERLRY